MKWQSWSWSLLVGLRHVVIWPLLRLLWLTLYVLHWLALPFIYLFYVVRAAVAWPLRILAHFEALWYFLGWAIVVGIFFGGGAYVVQRVFALTLDLDRKPVPKPIPPTGHDAASYRAARAERRTKEKERKDRHAMRVKLLASQSLIQDVVREARTRPVTLTSPISPNTSTVATRSGLFQDIILEQTDEEEDDDDESVF